MIELFVYSAKEKIVLIHREVKEKKELDMLTSCVLEGEDSQLCIGECSNLVCLFVCVNILSFAAFATPS